MIPVVPATTVPTVVDGAYCHSTPLRGLIYSGLVPLDFRLLSNRFPDALPFASLPSRSPCLAPGVPGWRSSSLSSPGSLALARRLFVHATLHHFGYTVTILIRSAHGRSARDAAGITMLRSTGLIGQRGAPLPFPR
jgi:hypothetical protein